MILLMLTLCGEMINIPDPEFKQILVSRFDTNFDGEIDTDEAAEGDIIEIRNLLKRCNWLFVFP